MRLGSGSERRRCIMQFSLAAGSDSAVRDRGNIELWPGWCLNFNPHGFQWTRHWNSKRHTYALHEGRVEAVGEQRLRQLPEVQLQRPSDGVDVHVAQHHQDIFGICRWDRHARSEHHIKRRTTMAQQLRPTPGMISSLNNTRQERSTRA